MASTNFVDNVTIVQSSWLNDINNFYYNLCGGGHDANSIRQSLNAVSKGGDTVAGNYTNTGNITTTTLNTTANASIGGGLSVSVNTVLGGTLQVTGNSTLGPVSSGAITSSGTVSAPTVASTSLSVSNTATIGIASVTTLSAANGSFTNSPIGPTPVGSDNTNKMATTAFVQSAVAPLAPINSPSFTGSPTAPTQANGDNSNKIATTQYVANNAVSTSSPNFTGVPTAPTAGAGTNTNQIATTSFVQTALSGLASQFTSIIVPFPVTIPPTGWLECNGQAVSRTTYASLFLMIGTMYGSGNGTTTFNIPDLRGTFIRGWNHGAGVDPDASSRTNRGDGITGDNVGTKQTDQLKSHVHIINTSQFSNNTPAGFVTSANAGGFNINSAATGGNETRPLNTYMMYCIKY